MVVVRGDDSDPDSSRRQAEAFRRRWPAWQRYGLSAYYAEDDDAVADLAADQLERFAVLGLYDPVGLIAAGVEVVPTSAARTSHSHSAISTSGCAVSESEGFTEARRRAPW